MPLDCHMPPWLCGLEASPPHRLDRRWRDVKAIRDIGCGAVRCIRLVIMSRSYVGMYDCLLHAWSQSVYHVDVCGSGG